MKSLNLNATIKVKLTPKGVDIFYRQHDKLNKYLKSIGGLPIKSFMPQIDEEGYTKLQLWRFMEIYGEHLELGMSAIIDGLNIYIEESDLEEVG